MKSDLPDFSLSSCLVFSLGREIITFAFCRAGLLNLPSGFSCKQVLKSFGLLLYKKLGCLFLSLWGSSSAHDAHDSGEQPYVGI